MIVKELPVSKDKLPYKKAYNIEITDKYIFQINDKTIRSIWITDKSKYL